MSKRLCSSLTLSTTLMLMVAEVNFSHIPSVNSEPLVTTNLNIDEPNCYIQLSDGRTLDLSNLCAKSFENSSGKVPEQFSNVPPELATLINKVNEVCSKPGKCSSRTDLINEIKKICETLDVCVRNSIDVAD